MSHSTDPRLFQRGAWTGTKVGPARLSNRGKNDRARHNIVLKIVSITPPQGWSDAVGLAQPKVSNETEPKLNATEGEQKTCGDKSHTVSVFRRPVSSATNLR